MSCDKIFSAADGKFLQPEEVGSSIRYQFTATARVPKDPKEASVQVEGEIALSDCNRIITWSWYDADEDGLQRLDAAIAMLQQARAAMTKALRVAARKRKQLGVEKE